MTLTQVIGVEPSPDIAIDNQQNAALPDLLTMPVDQLIERAMTGRPDLQSQVSEIRAADDEVRAARADYRPKISFAASGAQTSVWPTSSYGVLGSASKPHVDSGADHRLAFVRWRRTPR